MDFLLMQREFQEKYGTTDADWEPYRKTAIVRFEKDEKGYVLGRINRKVVFRDNSSNEIQPGETWIVSLVENTGPSKNYFAKPIMKLDSAFMFDLRKDQLDMVAEHLWNEQRGVLEPMFEERYKETIGKRIADATEEVRKKTEERIAEMSASMEKMEARAEEDASVISSLENRIEELNKQLEAKEAELKDAKVNAKPVTVTPQKEIEFEQTDFSGKNVEVTRTGPDSISSKSFRKARYFVNLSADHRFLLIRADNTAGILCMDGTIVLAGLSEISPFEGEGPMDAEYSRRYEGYIVYLK